MYSLRKILVFICRARQSLGFGVHSPFMYQLIVDVFYERLPFYSYDYLKRLEVIKELPSCSVKVNKLLFRLVNYFKPSTIIELGTGNGASAVWMSYAKKCDSIVTFSDTNLYEDRIRTFLSNYPAIKYVSSFSVDKIKCLLDKKDNCWDFVHIAHTDKYKEIFELLLGKAGPDTIVVIENISNPAKRNWWKEIESDARTGITVDLYDVGIVFFDKRHTKRAFKLIF